MAKEKDKEKLEQKIEQFSQAFAQLPDSVIVTDSNFNIVSINKTCEELYGYTLEDLAGKRPDLLNVEPMAEAIQQEIYDTVARNEIWRSSATNIRKDGSKFLCDLTISALTDEQGKPFAYIGTQKDVTESKKTEEVLKGYKSIVSSSKDMLALLDKDFIYIAANDVYLDSFGKNHDEIRGHSVSEVFGEDFFEKVIKPNAERSLKGETVQYNDWFDFPVSGRKHMEINYYPYRDFEGEIQGFVVNGRDITEKKKVEDALKKSKHDLGERVKELTGLYSIERLSSSTKKVDVLFNKFVKELVPPSMQYPDKCGAVVELDGKKYSNVDPKDIRTKLSAAINVKGKQRGILTVGYTENLEFIPKHEINLVRGYAKRIGKLIEIKEAEEELRKYQEKITEAQKMDSIGNLAGGVAHDFNNMLGAMLGYTGVLSGQETDPKKLKYVHGIEKAINRCTELTGKLLAFGRRGKFLLQPINLNDVITEVYSILKHSIDKNINLETKFDHNIYSIDGDPGQIHQMLMNLCVNASEAMNGDGTLIVQTEKTNLNKKFCKTHNLEPGKYVLLNVTDTGYGMTKETREKVFEPFFTTKNEGDVKGTGLGLAMVYGIIKNHNGDVSVYSELNEGTTFKIYLPAGEKDQQKTTKNLESKIIRKGKGTILLVDDEELIIDSTTNVLKELGYTVITAKDGLEAVKIYKQRHKEIDATILDMVMPNMGGRDTYIQMKEINHNVKAILATGYSMNGKAQEILEIGVKDFIQKPYTLQDISQKLRQLIK